MILLWSLVLFLLITETQGATLDDQLIADAIQAERETQSPNRKKINRRGVVGKRLENEVRDSDFSKSNFGHNNDDYSDFEQKALGRDRSDELNTVTLGPSTMEDSRPQLDPSEIAVGNRVSRPSHETFPSPASGMKTPLGTNSKGNSIPYLQPRPPRMGYYFQHYPWWLLPRQYRLRSKDFGYVYPPQYQNSKYYWPGRLPNDYDPYAIYYQTQQARASYQQNIGGEGYGSGAPGGGFGEPPLHESENNQSGEVELSKKADPLDDLSLETLEKIDKLGEDGLVAESETDSFVKSKRVAPMAKALASRI